MILTAEADSLSTDAGQLLEDCGFVGCHSARSDDLSVHARIDTTGYVRSLWESCEENTHAAMFAMKFGKKAEEVITDSQARKADALFHTLESIAIAVEVLNAVTSTFLRII